MEPSTVCSGQTPSPGSTTAVDAIIGEENLAGGGLARCLWGISLKGTLGTFPRSLSLSLCFLASSDRHSYQHGDFPHHRVTAMKQADHVPKHLES